MNDCRVPELQGYDVARLRIEFEGDRAPWVYQLPLNGRSIQGVYVDGERYESVTKMECKLQDANLYAGIRMAQRDRAYERIAELEKELDERYESAKAENVGLLGGRNGNI